MKPTTQEIVELTPFGLVSLSWLSMIVMFVEIIKALLGLPL